MPSKTKKSRHLNKKQRRENLRWWTNLVSFVYVIVKLFFFLLDRFHK